MQVIYVFQAERNGYNNAHLIFSKKISKVKFQHWCKCTACDGDYIEQCLSIEQELLYKHKEFQQCNSTEVMHILHYIQYNPPVTELGWGKGCVGKLGASS